MALDGGGVGSMDGHEEDLKQKKPRQGHLIVSGQGIRYIKIISGLIHQTGKEKMSKCDYCRLKEVHEGLTLFLWVHA